MGDVLHGSYDPLGLAGTAPLHIFLAFMIEEAAHSPGSDEAGNSVKPADV
jgi:hypothetical protein